MQQGSYMWSRAPGFEPRRWDVVQVDSHVILGLQQFVRERHEQAKEDCHQAQAPDVVNLKHDVLGVWTADVLEALGLALGERVLKGAGLDLYAVAVDDRRKEDAPDVKQGGNGGDDSPHIMHVLHGAKSLGHVYVCIDRG